MVKLKIFLFILISMTVFLQACVDEGVLEFPDEEAEEVILTESISLVSYLNHLSISSDACFEFVYPFEVGLSNGINISISSEEGLQNAILGQNSDLYLSSIEFPVVIYQDRNLRFIDNEEQLVRLLWECNVSTLRESLLETYAQCYEFQYPFDVLNENGDSISIPNLEFLLQLGSQSSELYQPQLVYPIAVDVWGTNESLEISNEYDLYQVMNTCDGCPNLYFEIEEEDNHVYKMIADIDLLRAGETFKWFINNEEIEANDSGNSFFKRRLAPGTYEICMKAESEDCVLGTEFCRTLEIETGDCPYLYFDYEKLEERSYIFEADFPAMNNIEYKWMIYKAGESPAIFSAYDSGLDFFEYFFEEPGTYSVCLEYQGGDCNFVCFCKEIIVE